MDISLIAIKMVRLNNKKWLRESYLNTEVRISIYRAYRF
jgi:hypothetical protein